MLKSMDWYVLCIKQVTPELDGCLQFPDADTKQYSWSGKHHNTWRNQHLGFELQLQL